MPQPILFILALAALTAAAANAAPDSEEGDRPPAGLSALAADVPYAAVDALGLGFSSQEVGPKTIVVTVNGAAATSLNRLVTIAVARASEIGLERKWPKFLLTELKRTSDCETWNDDRRTVISAGRPKLTITVVYDPEAANVEIRDSAETFKEMRKRLELATTSEQEKQATVDWVLEYCASTGVKTE